MSLLIDRVALLIREFRFQFTKLSVPLTFNSCCDSLSLSLSQLCGVHFATLESLSPLRNSPSQPPHRNLPAHRAFTTGLHKPLPNPPQQPHSTTSPQEPPSTTTSTSTLLSLLFPCPSLCDLVGAWALATCHFRRSTKWERVDHKSDDRHRSSGHQCGVEVCGWVGGRGNFLFGSLSSEVAHGTKIL